MERRVAALTAGVLNAHVQLPSISTVGKKDVQNDMACTAIEAVNQLKHGAFMWQCSWDSPCHVQHNPPTALPCCRQLGSILHSAAGFGNAVRIPLVMSEAQPPHFPALCCRQLGPVLHFPAAVAMQSGSPLPCLKHNRPTALPCVAGS